MAVGDHGWRRVAVLAGWLGSQPKGTHSVCSVCVERPEPIYIDEVPREQQSGFSHDLAATDGNSHTSDKICQVRG